MSYIFGLLMNIFSIAAIIAMVVGPFTWFVLFPLWAMELWKKDKNTLTKTDWDNYNKYAKDDPTITPDQWKKYGYAYRQWYLHSQRDMPFWSWYNKIKKRKRFMVKSWEYKKY